MSTLRKLFLGAERRPPNTQLVLSDFNWGEISVGNDEGEMMIGGPQRNSAGWAIFNFVWKMFAV